MAYLRKLLRNSHRGKGSALVTELKNMMRQCPAPKSTKVSPPAQGEDNSDSETSSEASSDSSSTDS
eukprot:6849600-Alexandrium_andersonii.AAC.1